MRKANWPVFVLLLVILSVLAIIRRCPHHSAKAKATRCPSTPMITGSLDAMMQTNERRESASR